MGAEWLRIVFIRWFFDWGLFVWIITSVGNCEGWVSNPCDYGLQIYLGWPLLLLANCVNIECNKLDRWCLMVTRNMKPNHGSVVVSLCSCGRGRIVPLCLRVQVWWKFYMTESLWFQPLLRYKNVTIQLIIEFDFWENIETLDTKT